MKGSGFFKVMCLFGSMLIIVSAAPFESEIRSRKEESHFYMPPFVPPKREEAYSYTGEKDDREASERGLAENEVPEKFEREFGEEDAETFFRRLERELAMKTARSREELLDRGLPEAYEEIPAEYKDDERSVSDENELELFNRAPDKEFEEKEMADEENNREHGEEEEDFERFRNPEGIYAKEMSEESEEKPNREFKGKVSEENFNHRRESSEEEKENEDAEEDFLRELLEQSDENFNRELEDKASEDDEMDETLDQRSYEAERMGIPRATALLSMLEYPSEEFPEWNEKVADNRLRELEGLDRRAKESPKHMREREAAREGERFDRYGNEEREREELRERQRERALGDGLKVHEKETEGRKQREERGPLGIRRGQQERFRFSSRGE